MNRLTAFKLTVIPLFSTIILLLTTSITFAATLPSHYEYGMIFQYNTGVQHGDGDTPYQISGIVWTDLNRNGLQDGQEPMVSSETVFVAPDAEGDVAQILVLFTDEQGQFSANNLVPGRYRVWTTSLPEADALVATVSDDRTVMAIEVPLAGFTIYMPHIRK